MAQKRLFISRLNEVSDTDYILDLALALVGTEDVLEDLKHEQVHIVANDSDDALNQEDKAVDEFMQGEGEYYLTDESEDIGLIHNTNLEHKTLQNA